LDCWFCCQPLAAEVVLAHSRNKRFNTLEDWMKKIVLALVAFFAALNFAFAADANSASKAELEAIKGIGPTIADRIIEERKKGGFKDIKDLEERVKGIGEENVKKMAAAGLTVGGGKAAAPKAEAKADAKKDAPKAEAKADAKKDAPKAEAKADAKKDAPKAEAKADAKKDAPKADAPKADAPKADAKADAKKDAPKADAKADAKKDAKKDAPKADAKPEAKAEKKAEAKADKKSDKPAAKDEKKDDKK
jgi:competence protein ComEA